MTKKNLIIIICLLTVIDLVAAGWYATRRIEASGKSQSLFGQRDSTEYIAMADTITSTTQADVFDKLHHNTYYFTANTPAKAGDNTSYYTSTKHVKVCWPQKVNGNDDLTELNKELIKVAFGTSHSQLKEARYAYLNTPVFNNPTAVGDDYRTLVKAPRVYPLYGNVSQVLVYPYMTSLRLLVIEVDKVEYDGNSTDENNYYIHYDRQNQRLLSRPDILITDASKENQLLKVINNKIDELNKKRGEDHRFQHALNVPADICCSKKGVLFLFKQGSISNEPIEIMIDYDKLSPFFTNDFKQLQDNNEGYWLYKNKIKPEPINPQPEVKKQPVATTPKNTYKRSYTKKKKSSYYKRPAYKPTFKPKRTNRKRYNGARHRSGYYGYAGKRHSSHRRR